MAGLGEGISAIIETVGDRRPGMLGDRLPGMRHEWLREIEESAKMWATDGPHLLEVAIDVRANAYPKIAFGHPISEMEPFAVPKAIEST